MEKSIERLVEILEDNYICTALTSGKKFINYLKTGDLNCFLKSDFPSTILCVVMRIFELNAIRELLINNSDFSEWIKNNYELILEEYDKRRES